MPKSQSKSSLGFETAKNIVKAHCQAEITNIEVLEGGYFASVYCVTLENNARVVLKTTPETRFNMSYEKNLIHAEHAMLQLLHRIGLPVPNIITFDSSRQFLEHPFLLTEFIVGQTFDTIKTTLSETDRTNIEQEIGRILQKTNGLCGTGYGGIAPDAMRSKTWREAFLEMLHSVIEDGLKKNVPLPCDPVLLEQQILEVAEVLEAVQEPRLVLFDLWDGNVMIHENRLVKIFDLERALWGDPLLEYQWKTFAPSPDFLIGYGKNLLLEPTAPLRRSLYNVFLTLIMVIECTYRQYDTPDFEIWARNELQKELERFEQLRRK
jgi:aminoglycoside phosphotransferase (APT) family kinase protein